LFAEGRLKSPKSAKPAGMDAGVPILIAGIPGVYFSSRIVRVFKGMQWDQITATSSVVGVVGR
jgi:hypothetical protein